MYHNQKNRVPTRLSLSVHLYIWDNSDKFIFYLHDCLYMSKIVDVISKMNTLVSGLSSMLDSSEFNKEDFVVYVQELASLTDQEVSEISVLTKNDTIINAVSIVHADSKKILNIVGGNIGSGLTNSQREQIKKFLLDIKKLDAEIARLAPSAINKNNIYPQTKWYSKTLIVGVTAAVMAWGLIAYDLFRPLSFSERRECFDWLCDAFSTKGFKYAAKYLHLYIHPEMLSNNPKMTSWNEKVPGSYPVYNIAPDWNNAGFSFESLIKIISEAGSKAGNKNEILKRLESGKEALLLIKGRKLAPLEEYAMGDFSFYAQKRSSGKITIRVKDIYDFRSKKLLFTIGDNDAEKIISSSFPNGKIHKYSLFRVYYLDDSFWIEYGNPYIMIGEWEIDEATFYKYFSN